jgi:hypothetical protein
MPRHAFVAAQASRRRRDRTRRTRRTGRTHRGPRASGRDGTNWSQGRDRSDRTTGTGRTGGHDRLPQHDRGAGVVHAGVRPGNILHGGALPRTNRRHTRTSRHAHRAAAALDRTQDHPPGAGSPATRALHAASHKRTKTSPPDGAATRLPRAIGQQRGAPIITAPPPARRSTLDEVRRGILAGMSPSRTLRCSSRRRSPELLSDHRCRLGRSLPSRGSTSAGASVPAPDPDLHAGEPHDVLAAHEFDVGAANPVRHHGPLQVPEDRSAVTEPHDILAAEEFPVPGRDPTKALTAAGKGGLTSASEAHQAAIIS